MFFFHPSQPLFSSGTSRANLINSLDPLSFLPFFLPSIIDYNPVTFSLRFIFTTKSKYKTEHCHSLRMQCSHIYTYIYI
jgi:hypothetical protein